MTNSKEERRRKIRDIAKKLPFRGFNRKIDILIETDIQYKDLAEYLEKSGLVYELRQNDIWIWHFYYNDFFKLVGLDLSGHQKILNLLPM